MCGVYSAFIRAVGNRRLRYDPFIGYRCNSLYSEVCNALIYGVTKLISKKCDTETLKGLRLAIYGFYLVIQPLGDR